MNFVFNHTVLLYFEDINKKRRDLRFNNYAIDYLRHSDNDENEKSTKKDMLKGKRKDKKDKDKGYAALEGESSDEEKSSWYRNHREKNIYNSYDDISVRASKKGALGCPTFLRRSHSVAVSKENLLSGLIQSSKSKKKNLEEQFIPRAKLVEKSLSREQRLSLQNHYPKLRNFSALGIERKNHSETCLNNIEYASLSNLRWQSTEYMTPYARNITRNFAQNNFTSLNNLSPSNWNFNEFETSISYDDNITLARKKVEDQTTKPKTIRAPTPYYQSNVSRKSLSNNDKLNRVSQENLLEAQEEERKLERVADNFEELRQIISENPRTSLDTNIEKIYDEANRPSGKPENIYAEYQESDNPSSLDFETNTNFDEIHLENDNIHREKNRKSSETPKLPVKDYFKTYKLAKPKDSTNLVGIIIKEEQGNNKVITRIKVESNTVDKDDKNHISEVLVEPNPKDTSKDIKEDTLKPNFLMNKKLIKTKSNSKQNLLCLCEKFSSLPDTSADKNSQKYEKTDATLRKLQNSPKMSKILEGKFVVNIGRHFDISEKSGRREQDYNGGIKSLNNKIYVDKKPIAKISWSTTNLKNQTVKMEKNNTSVNRSNLSNNTSFRSNNEQEQTERYKLNYSADEEIKRKLENMRQYWNKIGNAKKKSQESTCKIVDLQKKMINNEENHENRNICIQKSKENVNKNLLNNLSQNGMTNSNLKVNKSDEQPQELKTADKKNSDSKEKLQKSKTIADFAVLKNHRNDSNLLKKMDENYNEIPYNSDNKCQSLIFDNSLTGTKLGDSKDKETLNGKGVLPSIKKQLFYNSLKVNRGFNQEELPNPETVRLTRQFFEKRLRQDDKIKSQSIRSVSGSLCDLSDLEGKEQVSEDILEKIREYGSTVTYYGGRIVEQNLGEPVLTNVIMKEIEGVQSFCK